MKAFTAQEEIVNGAPSPELVDLWLAKASTRMTSRLRPRCTTPTRVSSGGPGPWHRGSGARRRGDSRDHGGLHRFEAAHGWWRITGTDKDGNQIEVHHHGMEVMRCLPSGRWVFFIDHPWGPFMGSGPSSTDGLAAGPALIMTG